MLGQQQQPQWQKNFFATENRENKMALDSARLKAAIQTKIETALSQDASDEWIAISQAVAEAVVDELTANAVVSPGTMDATVPTAITGSGTIS
jgi:hypothetical protein